MSNSSRLHPARSALLLLVGAALTISACSTTDGSPQAQGAGGKSGSSATSTTPSASATTVQPKPKPKKRVHISLLNGDGIEYGVGMPVIAQFNKKIKSGVALQKATTVTVNGKPANGAWYFEYSDPDSGHVMEGHFRLANYWPAHSKIHVAIPAKGLSAGRDLIFGDSLTLDFTTGPANIAVVDDSSHTMTVTSDGKKFGTFPVSLGAADTPTRSGTKVIMEKGASICMHGPGYDECGVKDTQRLTYDGEYLHSAPWNLGNIGHTDSSNGCTNLTPGDAKTLFDFLRIGDVVKYPNANGGAMQLGQGYGDWNVPWGTWQTGGAVPTS